MGYGFDLSVGGGLELKTPGDALLIRTQLSASIRLSAGMRVF